MTTSGSCHYQDVGARCGFHRFAQAALWKDGIADDNAAATIHQSKATGEPPLLLPFSVFYAIRDAVSAAGGHRVDPPLTAPATSEAILRAVTAVQAG